jgi:hypothetical protein
VDFASGRLGATRRGTSTYSAVMRSGPSERAPSVFVTLGRQSNDLRRSLWGVEIVVSIRHDPVVVRPAFSLRTPPKTRLLNYLNAAGVITQYVLTVPKSAGGVVANGLASYAALVTGGSLPYQKASLSFVSSALGPLRSLAYEFGLLLVGPHQGR